jgi:P-type E1-E2 ATPase
VLAEAARCAQGSRHPVARAVAAQVPKAGEITPTEEVPGRGLLRRDDESLVRLGSAAWLREAGLVVPPDPAHLGPLVWLARDDRVLGVLLLADRPRPESRAALAALRALGVDRILLITGDHAEAAHAVAGELGVDAVYAHCLPETKLETVEREKAAGRLVMVVGDGVNDALALRRADVGVAMGAMGSALAVNSADVALMSSDLSRLPQTFRLARQTRSTITQNVLIAGGSTVAMLWLAALGALGPIGAALVQNIGTVLVVLNSGRLLRFDGR